MRSNGLLKWLMIPVALLVLFVAIRLVSGGSPSAPPAADAGSKLTPEEMKALGIEGDTPRDTVASHVAPVKDRKRYGLGRGGFVRVELGGPRNIQKKKQN